VKYARHQGFLKIVSLGVVAPWMALCGVLACLPRCDNEFSQPIPVIEASVPNELCQPKEGMGAPQYPVGTRGGVGWMWGPCACPPRGVRQLAARTLTASWGQQDKHKAPSPPRIYPLSLQIRRHLTPFGGQNSSSRIYDRWGNFRIACQTFSFIA